MVSFARWMKSRLLSDFLIFDPVQ